MRRWLLALVLGVAAAAPRVAHADPVAQMATDRTAADALAAQARVAELANRRAALAQRYQTELDAVDRLKKQRASWRRDRELRSAMSDASDTADQLTRATRELAAAQSALAQAKKAQLGAIDIELRTATGARASELSARRTALAAQVGSGARKIVLPDLKIDPLADPEELDQQAAALRASEAELTRQVAGLGAQATDLDRVADLRKHHDRASDLANRDDDQPQHSAQRGQGARETLGDSSPAPASGGTNGTDAVHTPGGPAAPVAAPTFEAEATVALADVVDASTIDSLSRASRSGDPAQRAAAAHKAHDAVAARLEQLRKMRAEVEARAKSLRTKR